VIILPGSDLRLHSDTVYSVDGLLVGLDLDGVTWLCESLSGWSMGGGVETQFSPRPGRHGSYDGPVYRRERVIAMEGVCVADSRLLAELAADTLAATLADGSMGVFTVSNDVVGVRSVRVRLSAQPECEWLDSGVAFRWQLQFTAPDYRKFGVAESQTTRLAGGGTGLSWPVGSFFNFGQPRTGGRLASTNTGTAPSEPTFTVTGPLGTGFQLTHLETGRRLRYESPVGDEVLIDGLEGAASSGGQDRTGLLTVDEFFTVPSGQTATFVFATLGSETHTDPPTCTASLAPAYY